jgi:hypothetical protein
MNNKLGKIIERFMQGLRKNIRVEDPEIEKRWSFFKEELGVIYDALKAQNNLRIHDPITGGIFRGNVQSRIQHKEHWDPGFKGLLCHRKNLNGEVGYSRAIFNKKCFDVIDPMNRPAGRVAMVAYEAPLLRKKTDKLNREIDSKFAKCDLIGLFNNSLAAIEVKVEPEQYATYLPYALVESFAYGYYLNRHLRDGNSGAINSEMRFCLDQFNVGAITENLDELNVEYFVAAPVKYYATYLLGGEKSDKWYTLRIEEIRRIERLIFNHQPSDPQFGGYLAINRSQSDVAGGIDFKSGNCFPNFDQSPITVKQYSNFTAIKNENNYS